MAKLQTSKYGCQCCLAEARPQQLILANVKQVPENCRLEFRELRASACRYQELDRIGTLDKTLDTQLQRAEAAFQVLSQKRAER